MKNLKKKNKNGSIFFFYTGLIFTFFVFTVFFSLPRSTPVTAQENPFLGGEGNPITKLLTDPFFRIRTDTGIDGTLAVRRAVRAPVFDIISQGFRGRIYTDNLTEERRYFFPNLSGEICLTAGNCDFSPSGIPDRLAKFTDEGLIASSVTDFETTTGIGITNPAHRLHVGGRVHAEGDICTDLGGGFCLSSVGEGQESFSESIIEGEGNVSHIPLWRDDRKLGDSVIYQSEESIGIGVLPSSTLDVAGTVRMLGFRLPVNPTQGYGLMTDDRGFGTWRPVLTPEGTAADIAERFPINPLCKNKGNCPEPGDVVSVTNDGFIEKSSSPYDPNLIGIVSTEPEMTLNAILDPKTSRPVALIGQVPLKVSFENGSISAGDLLTSSSVSGVAMKASSSGRVVGMALESVSSKKETAKTVTVNTLVNPHYNGASSPEEYLTITDKKTGVEYCLQIIDGRLIHSPCK